MAVTVANANAITFPAATSGTETVTYMGIGRDAAGAGEMLFRFALTPSIPVAAPIQPIVASGQAVATGSGGGFNDVSHKRLMELWFQNADMTNVGDAGGLRGSVAAGNFYASLHTADPGLDGGQTSNEATYGSYARVAITRAGGSWTILNT